MLALLLALSAQAQGPAVNSQLEPLAFLVGSCWRGTFPDGRRTDTHCFTPVHSGAFVRDRHVVEGAPQPYSGETLYRWDAESRVIRFNYYASDGSHSAGTALSAANGLVFPEETHRAPDGNAMLIRSSWTRDGEDAYVVLSEAREGEAWRRLWQMRMVRTVPAPP
ncbi:MAG TPA: hypothetical protein VEW71_00685 [Allosphingosinicella sp.]|nr:hypothetical protein [Allosphingosinicella sp.]